LPDLITQTEQRFGIKGLDFLIPERLLMVNRMGPGNLPVMLVELDLNHLKAFFLEQATAFVKAREMASGTQMGV